MQREIKFRAWDKEAQEMLTVRDINFCGNHTRNSKRNYHLGGQKLKIGDLDQHCGNCSISEYCGNPFGYCLCRDGRFSNMEESKYSEIAMTATHIKEFEACEDCKRPECESYRYSDFDYENEECEHNDEARDYFCEQVANYVENAMKGAVKE